ncbi:sulfatase family protein [Tunicatimonas pelagia]|uniref:sulfatase family protein n=1 Tax=Tunicatimonas pelagia TaxID=931531 RepID=UPI0026663800|nr:sulfatase [Tunicatimonas pelagia]WKN43221.1 sulfatase [Tunicatimonas pelagia]
MRTLLSFIACLWFNQAVFAQTGSDKPNIVVFIADDAGWRDFGCYGNPAIRTPNIDQLAADGIRFTNVFLPTPQCSPTRTSLLTGQFAHTLRTEDLHTPLDVSEKTVAHHLGEAGYYTALLGKSHIGKEATAQFDYFNAGKENPRGQDLATALDNAGEQPIFAWFAFFDPHRSYQPNTIANPHDLEEVVVPPYLADTPETRQDLAMYYDEINRMDSVIGASLALLEDRSRRENTVVIFMSDNGKPFTRAKGTLYDEGIKTPFIVNWPARIAEARVNSNLLTTLRLAPTVLDIAGVDKPQKMFAESMASLFTEGNSVADEYVYGERNWHDCDEHMRSVRSDSFKLIVNSYIELPHGTAADLAGSPSHQSLLRLKEKGELNEVQSLVFQVPRPAIELYDVINDPFELNNLAFRSEYRPIIREHYGALQQWMKETNDFPPHFRRRYDNTDRVTGAMFLGDPPEMYAPLPEKQK